MLEYLSTIWPKVSWISFRLANVQIKCPVDYCLQNDSRWHLVRFVMTSHLLWSTFCMGTRLTDPSSASNRTGRFLLNRMLLSNRTGLFHTQWHYMRVAWTSLMWTEIFQMWLTSILLRSWHQNSPKVAQGETRFDYYVLFGIRWRAYITLLRRWYLIWK